MQGWTTKEISIISDTSIPLDTLALMMPHRTKAAIGLKATRLGHQRSSGLPLFRVSRNYEELLVDQEFCETINGELLGDGCITLSNNKYPVFTYSSVNKEYVEYLHQYLANKLQSKSQTYTYHTKPHFIGHKEVISPISYGMRLNHHVFMSFYDRWYVDGKKNVPHDFLLSARACKHWYIGDGSISRKNNFPHIRLSTDSFSETDVEWLSKSLHSIGVQSKVYKERGKVFIVHILGRNALQFLEYIGACPVKSYAYKWDVGEYRRFDKTCICGTIFTSYGSKCCFKRYCSKKCQIKYKGRG